MTRALAILALPIVVAPVLVVAAGVVHAQPAATPVPLDAPPPPAPEPPFPPPPPGQELLDEDPPPLGDLPPPPESGPPPASPAEMTSLSEPSFTKPAPVPSPRRVAFHLGTAFGFEVARDGGPAFALGAGAQLGWEIYWPSFGIELAAAIQAHGDTTPMPDRGFWEAHPIAYVKRPFKGGVWELFAGYGASPASLHAGDFARDQHVHVVELGLEDRTTRFYSRLFVRCYAPFDGDLFGAPTAIVAASVGVFHLSKKKN